MNTLYTTTKTLLELIKEKRPDIEIKSDYIFIDYDPKLEGKIGDKWRERIKETYN